MLDNKDSGLNEAKTKAFEKYYSVFNWYYFTTTFNNDV